MTSNLGEYGVTKHSSSSVQTVDRAIGILRLLSEAGPGGLRLVEIQKIPSLTRPTAHRLLSSLPGQGLAREAVKRRYHLGLDLAMLGVSAQDNIARLRKVCEPHVQYMCEPVNELHRFHKSNILK